MPPLFESCNLPATQSKFALDEGVEGLERFEQATSDLYFPRGLDPPLVIDCPKASGIRFPSCRVRSVLSPGVVLRYTYSVEHLSSWKTVDEGLRELVARFAADARRSGRGHTDWGRPGWPDGLQRLPKAPPTSYPTATPTGRTSC